MDSMFFTFVLLYLFLPWISDNCIESGRYVGQENDYADVIYYVPDVDSVDMCQKECLQKEECYFWMLDSRYCGLFKSTATAVPCEDDYCLRGPRVCQGKDNVNRILASLKSNNDN